MFSAKMRKKSHSPAARRKAVATMRRNGTGPFRHRKLKGSIPLSAIPGRKPARRKKPEPQYELTLAGRLAVIASLAVQLAELLRAPA